ncbi:NADH-quinone oxidoreductase subunit M [Nonomuraea longispora]|uniref:NADH-quinone oxidoreductase subunit M n=2 Tax=Nonomuraea longispora TaxID=1848320 RepID=A0A4R4N8A4_9ACTN|nr:NADH-quinone oxidoreductase subunit M [Nonomuraea longispora]TDC05055.1 NADH-quinone oxidoreductase subunit M [Nonomuraea longispora]
MGWLPVALLAVPLVGALLLLLAPHALRPRLRAYGLVLSGVTLALAVLMVAVFDYAGAARPQFEVDQPWIAGLGLRFHLGVDGISLPLVALTALLTFLCFVYLCWGRERAGEQLMRARPRALVFTLLVLEVGMIGTFLALDLLLFFVFFEVVLIPMYFLIAIWGGEGRGAASAKFILYTLLGSVVMLLGLLLVWAQTGTLDIEALAAAHGAGMARSVQILAFVAIGVGLAVKTPMWPLHTWLPDAHTEAPTVGSVLLAGVLLKMGTYGFARIAIPILPDGAAAVAPWLGALAVVGIVYGALACLAQRDLKRMIAYSSVGHMGFVLLGFATLTPVGVNGALFANVAHGLITGLLFFLAGAVKDRYHTADMPSLGGGMLATLPRLGSLLTFASIASLGLPGLAGFWGEMLALFGAFQPANVLPRPLFLTYMVIGGLGAVLTAAYFLVMLSRVTHGRPQRPARPAARVLQEVGGPPPAVPDDVAGPPPAVLDDVGRPPGDVRTHELLAWTPLVVLILLFGLWPGLLLSLTTPAVLTLLGVAS